MKVKEDNIDQFISAMYHLVKAIKNETESCGKLCGGINEKELIVIGYVGQNLNVKMSDIAENIDAPMSTLTSIVDKLVDKGYLSRDHSGEDRRVINVSLANNGKVAYQALLTKKRFVAGKVLSNFSEDDQKNFITHLNILASSISNLA